MNSYSKFTTIFSKKWKCHCRFLWWECMRTTWESHPTYWSLPSAKKWERQVTSWGKLSPQKCDFFIFPTLRLKIEIYHVVLPNQIFVGQRMFFNFGEGIVCITYIWFMNYIPWTDLSHYIRPIEEECGKRVVYGVGGVLSPSPIMNRFCDLSFAAIYLRASLITELWRGCWSKLFLRSFQKWFSWTAFSTERERKLKIPCWESLHRTFSSHLGFYRLSTRSKRSTGIGLDHGKT